MSEIDYVKSGWAQNTEFIVLNEREGKNLVG